MTTIKASCPTCGEVQLTEHGITLRICDNDKTRSTYTFTCPACHVGVEKPADDHIRSLLVGVVVVEWWHLPAEVLERPDGPPLTLDDLIDLHHELDEWAS